MRQTPPKPRHTVPRMTRSVLCLAALALVASGCGSSSASPASDEPSETAEPQTALEVAYDNCVVKQKDRRLIELADAGKTIVADGGPNSEGVEATACILGTLETPTSTITVMDATTSLQGRQSDTWGDFEASWTYHPDNGFDVVITEQ